MKSGSMELEFEFEGFGRDITVHFEYNEFSKDITRINEVMLTKTEQSLNFILGDEELTEHLSERINSQAEEDREEAKMERSLSYMDEY